VGFPVPARVEGLAEAGRVESRVGREPAQDGGVADVEAVPEERFQDAVVVGGPGAALAGELEPLPGQVRVGLRGDGREADFNAQPLGQRVDRAGPGLLQVVAVRA
jgi:hypothetical protein